MSTALTLVAVQSVIISRPTVTTSMIRMTPVTGSQLDDATEDEENDGEDESDEEDCDSGCEDYDSD